MKKKIAVITGGNSGEYEISIKSGKNIAAHIDKNRYDVYLIYIQGTKWFYHHQNTDIDIDKNDFSLTLPNGKITFDCVFIAIHGNPGENGKLQGYLEMLNIPYTGCDVLVSALTFNKNYCNRVLNTYDIRTAPSVHLFKNSTIDCNDIIQKLGLPCFVKPCNSGSSVGMSKVNTREELLPAIHTAFEWDNQILIEKFIKGREITCGVMSLNNEIKILAITEIISKKEYFDFEAKYNPALADELTPADLTPEIQTLCEEKSKKIYQVLGCKGIVRIDYIFNQDDMYFIEVNTIPGQTNESLVPKQLAIKNINFSELCSDFIEEAMAKRS
ncbi:MAG: D-alanine--D-alanine ligase [Bacteroidales bacterium]|nr:D-alanine--D-alanine ligase [Bacteroidales bacterium]